MKTSKKTKGCDIHNDLKKKEMEEKIDKDFIQFNTVMNKLSHYRFHDFDYFLMDRDIFS